MEEKSDNKLVNLLKDILESIKQPENRKIEKRTFSIKESALYLGIGHEKIRELVNKKNTDFPFFKVGERTVIDKNLLDKWIAKITEEHRNL